MTDKVWRIGYRVYLQFAFHTSRYFLESTQTQVSALITTNSLDIFVGVFCACVKAFQGDICLLFDLIVATAVSRVRSINPPPPSTHLWDAFKANTRMPLSPRTLPQCCQAGAERTDTVQTVTSCLCWATLRCPLSSPACPRQSWSPGGWSVRTPPLHSLWRDIRISSVTSLVWCSAETRKQLKQNWRTAGAFVCMCHHNRVINQLQMELNREMIWSTFDIVLQSCVVKQKLKKEFFWSA